MKTIYVPTKARGFLLNLFTFPFENYKFFWEENNMYEVNSKLKLLASKIVRSKLGNHLGIIQNLQVKEDNYDFSFSFNRFLNTDKSYVISLENPTALFHYSLGRNKTKLGKKRLKKNLSNKNLTAIVCISKACASTVKDFYDIPQHISIEQIYPLVLKNPYIDINSIIKKSYEKELRCLYISSNFNLKGGQDILKAFNRIPTNIKENIILTVITKLEDLDSEIYIKMKSNNNIELYDFNLNQEKLNKIYAKNNVLLNPSRQDSFSLVALEAMKAGNSILSTDLYALPEMVINNYNGFLIEPKYRFFTKENYPNEKVWNNREKTIYSNYVDEKVVNFLYNHVISLYKDRRLLEQFSINSFKLSNNEDFGEKEIVNKWEKIFGKI